MTRLRRFFQCGIIPMCVGIGSTSCATHYIQNTDVADSDDNRKVIAFCEKYRHAVELKDVDALLKMASEKYYQSKQN